MKDKNNISNSDKQVYKLKPEYMDDLVMKLDEHRPNNRKWIYIASSLVLLLFVSGAIFWYPNKNQIDNEESLKNRESSLMSELNTPSKIINDDKKETVVITNSNNELKTLTEERDKSVKNSSQSRKEETGTIKKTVKQKSRKSINKISANQVFANDIKTNETSELDSVIEEKLILKYEVKKEQKQTLDSIRNGEGDGAEEVSFELIVSDQKTDSSKGDSIDSNQTVFNNNSENKEEFKKETNIILDSNLNNKQSDSVSNKQDESIINDTLIEEDTTEAISMLDSTSIKLN
ncbi:hypothetical protein N9544_01610 [Flavobacteriales bacterium]|nr:hypothetical protein [Flavobacteriales bacterium]